MTLPCFVAVHVGAGSHARSKEPQYAHAMKAACEAARACMATAAAGGAQQPAPARAKQRAAATTRQRPATAIRAGQGLVPAAGQAQGPVLATAKQVPASTSRQGLAPPLPVQNVNMQDGGTHGHATAVLNGQGALATATVQQDRLSVAPDGQQGMSFAALDAVCAAICVLEDSPCTNAGYGSNLTYNGIVECDASVMDGETGAYGAVAAVRGVRNPCMVAGTIAKESLQPLSFGRVRPMILSGAGALTYAASRLLDTAPSTHPITTPANQQPSPLPTPPQHHTNTQLGQPVATISGRVGDHDGRPSYARARACNITPTQNGSGGPPGHEECSGLPAHRLDGVDAVNDRGAGAVVDAVNGRGAGAVVDEFLVAPAAAAAWRRYRGMVSPQEPLPSTIPSTVPSTVPLSAHEVGDGNVGGVSGPQQQEGMLIQETPQSAQAQPGAPKQQLPQQQLEGTGKQQLPEHVQQGAPQQQQQHAQQQLLEQHGVLQTQQGASQQRQHHQLGHQGGEGAMGRAMIGVQVPAMRSQQLPKQPQQLGGVHLQQQQGLRQQPLQLQQWPPPHLQRAPQLRQGQLPLQQHQQVHLQQQGVPPQELQQGSLQQQEHGEQGGTTPACKSPAMKRMKCHVNMLRQGRLGNQPGQHGQQHTNHPRQLGQHVLSGDHRQQGRFKAQPLSGQPHGHIVSNPVPEPYIDMETSDTVGAIVVDAWGRVAAGVSSGGLAMKLEGRVGEAAVFGAGCWAECQRIEGAGPGREWNDGGGGMGAGSVGRKRLRHGMAPVAGGFASSTTSSSAMSMSGDNDGSDDSGTSSDMSLSSGSSTQGPKANDGDVGVGRVGSVQRPVPKGGGVVITCTCSVGVSVTGVGEPIIRAALAKRCGRAIMRRKDKPLDEVVRVVVMHAMRSWRGAFKDCGVLAVRTVTTTKSSTPSPGIIAAIKRQAATQSDQASVPESKVHVEAAAVHTSPSMGVGFVHYTGTPPRDKQGTAGPHHAPSGHVGGVHGQSFELDTMGQAKQLLRTGNTAVRQPGQLILGGGTAIAGSASQRDGGMPAPVPAGGAVVRPSYARAQIPVDMISVNTTMTGDQDEQASISATNINHGASSTTNQYHLQKASGSTNDIDRLQCANEQGSCVDGHENQFEEQPGIKAPGFAATEGSEGNGGRAVLWVTMSRQRTRRPFNQTRGSGPGAQGSIGGCGLAWGVGGDVTCAVVGQAATWMCPTMPLAQVP